MAEGSLTREAALAMDEGDELAFLREAFALPEAPSTSTATRSARCRARARARLRRRSSSRVGRRARSELERGGLDRPAAPRCGDRIAPLIGAAPDEVVVADSTSVNLFKLLAGALRLRPGRRVILSEARQLPHRSLRGAGPRRRCSGGVELRLVPRGGLAAALDERAAVLHAHARRLPDRRDARHGRADPRRARRRRARAVGPLAQRRGGARGPRRLRRRPRGRLRLQVPERRPGRAGLRFVAAPPPGRLRDAARRLDGPRRAVRLRTALHAGAGHRAPRSAARRRS